MIDQFKAISLSHKNAPVDVREAVALSETESKELMLKLREVFELNDVLVVSTCNRTEVYYTATENHNHQIIKLLAAQKGIESETIHSYFESIEDPQASIQHLFEVSMGLHSQVVGDMQIPNQIKQAYQSSADLNMAGPFLHRLMHTIFFANKKVAQETSFRDGAASTSYATVSLIEEFISASPNAKILVIGLGEIGEDVCRNLATKDFLNVTLVNRTKEKSEKLAFELKFFAADFKDLDEEIERADVVISAIRNDEPIIKAANLKTHKRLSIKYLIDLAVPRSIAQDVVQLPGIVLYNIDEIQKKADAALEKRTASIPAVEAIIEASVAEFNDWGRELIVSPTIQKLKNALETIRKEEMARYTKTMTETEQILMDKVTASMMQKIIKLPVLQLKAACKRGEAETLIDVLNDLFNLEKESV
jgi:glutamyl-tRNA reductase